MSQIREHTLFSPLENGFHFVNDFTLVIGTIEYGGIGFCGGMCWAALDRYYTSQPVPSDTDIPSHGSPLFNELFRRQVDSFGDNFELLNKCVTWQQYSGNGGNPFLSFSDESIIGKITQTNEWPKIKQKIDTSIPASLCLIRANWNEKPWTNHQVLAIGYSFDTNDKKLIIYLYDPNYPDKNSYIEMTLERDNYELKIDHSHSSKKIRGFFLWPYDRCEKVITEAEFEVVEHEEDLSWFWTSWG